MLEGVDGLEIIGTTRAMRWPELSPTVSGYPIRSADRVSMGEAGADGLGHRLRESRIDRSVQYVPAA